MNKTCARCEKTVYPTEELKCLDKVWHKGCFKCQNCGTTLNMKTYKGYGKLPYCEAHVPKAKHTTMAETPELKRIAENTKLQSTVNYHADFVKSKGKFTQVSDDPETLRMQANTRLISMATYHGNLEKKAQMEKQRQINENGELVGKVKWQEPVLTSAVMCLLALACLSIIQKTSSLAGLWLPTAFLIPVLFHHCYLDWILLLCSAALGIAAAQALMGSYVLGYLPYTINNLIEATLCALLLRKALPRLDPLSGLNHWLKFMIVAVIFCPLISSVIMMMFILHIHTPAELQERFSTWFISESVAILALTPLGLIYQRGYLRQVLTSRRLIELLVTLVITLALGFMMLKWLPYYTFVSISFPLLWTSAIRLPRIEAFIIFLSMTLMIVLLQTSGIITIQPQGLIFLPLLLILLPVSSTAVVMHALRMKKLHITQSENRFRNVMEYSAIGIALVSPEGKWLHVNKSLCKLLGYDADYLKTLSLQDITHPEDLEKNLALLQQLLDDDIQSYTIEKRYLCRNGEIVWVLMAVSLVRDETQNPLYFISQIEDITERKHTETTNKRPEALHEQKELLHITLNSINEAVISTDRDLNITFMNPVAEIMTGWKESQARGQSVNHVVHITKGPQGPLLDNLQQFDIIENLYSSVEQSLVLHGHDTGMFDVQLEVSLLRTLKDEPIGIVLVLQDVSEYRELIRTLSYNASHDILTGLGNRGDFETSLKKALSLTAIQHQTHSLVFIDLDRFKAVNDTAGHAAGDELLRQISTLMQEHIRKSDHLTRLGGDEFALILFDCPLDQGLIIVQQLVEKINEFQFVWKEQIFQIGASAGLTEINDENISGSEYLAQADGACYSAKHNGRGRVFTYESRPKQQLSSHTALFHQADMACVLSENQHDDARSNIEYVPTDFNQQIDNYATEMLPPPHLPPKNHYQTPVVQPSFHQPPPSRLSFKNVNDHMRNLNIHNTPHQTISHQQIPHQTIPDQTIPHQTMSHQTNSHEMTPNHNRQYQDVYKDDYYQDYHPGIGKIHDYDPEDRNRAPLNTNRVSSTLVFHSDRMNDRGAHQQMPSQSRPIGRVTDYDPMTNETSRPVHQQPAPAPVPVQKVYIAMYDYEANDNDEVSFREGDVISNVSSIDEGWMTGQVLRTGRAGMLPANYVVERPAQPY